MGTIWDEPSHRYKSERLELRLEAKLLELIRAVAKEMDKSVSQLVRDAIREHVGRLLRAV